MVVGQAPGRLRREAKERGSVINGSCSRLLVVSAASEAAGEDASEGEKADLMIVARATPEDNDGFGSHPPVPNLSHAQKVGGVEPEARPKGSIAALRTNLHFEHNPRVMGIVISATKSISASETLLHVTREALEHGDIRISTWSSSLVQGGARCSI